MGAVAGAAALGATVGAIGRRAAIESLLLALAGCGLALLVALPALRLLTVMAGDQIPRLEDVHLNWDVLLDTRLLWSGSGYTLSLLRVKLSNINFR